MMYNLSSGSLKLGIFVAFRTSDKTLDEKMFWQSGLLKIILVLNHTWFYNYSPSYLNQYPTFDSQYQRAIYQWNSLHQKVRHEHYLQKLTFMDKWTSCLCHDGNVIIWHQGRRLLVNSDTTVIIYAATWGKEFTMLAVRQNSSLIYTCTKAL